MRSIFRHYGRLVIAAAIAALAVTSTYAQSVPAAVQSEKAEAVIAKAVQNLGGERYLNVKSQIGRGKFSVIKENTVVSFQTFVDVIVFPDKERTEFKGGGTRTIQTNVGNTGWVFDGAQELIKIQSEDQVANFKRGIRVSLDNLLRGLWKGDAEISYIGKRPATLGKRNEVIKLTYKDGLTVEFEFSADDGLPVKAIYKTGGEEGSEEVKEEDRYAQFIEVDGVRTPFIIDRFTNGQQSSRINYQSVEFNKSIPESIFAKPASAKDAKKDIKL
ncbi:MAG: outer membrane lipoprotein-sorting protein [Pyrinomonadaceae bacterium]|nr:outer membrane lipoprotein-sorting protein [Pyrinomonadaceae bacterium]